LPFSPTSDLIIKEQMLATIIEDLKRTVKLLQQKPLDLHGAFAML
jgi:hypothetical protein